GHKRAINALARLLAKPKIPASEPGPATEKSYWVIAPYSVKPQEEWEQVWKYDLANNIISVGWTDLDNISTLDEEELRAAIERTYAQEAATSKGLYFGMLWNFYHKIKVGDVILARQGTKKLAAIGTVIRTAYYDPIKSRAAVGDWYDFGNHLDVQ